MAVLSARVLLLLVCFLVTTGIGGATSDVGGATSDVGGDTSDVGDATSDAERETSDVGGATSDVWDDTSDVGDAREDVGDEEGAREEKAVPGSCPVCDERQCITDLQCGDGKVLVQDKSVCGCCPICEPILGLNDLCSPTFGPSCSPGLECDAVTTKCSVSTTRSCDSFAYLDALWKPSCLEDGSYAPKQCKGDTLTGRCFCTGGDGGRLFGQEWWALAGNMTCACSRQVWELQQRGRTDVTLHCDAVGSYEPLQCDNGMCWCAQPHTGLPITTIVTEDSMHVLPCYSATALGSQYLRQCESLLIAQARIGIEMKAHGTNYPTSSKTNCDPDGSFGNYQLDTYGRCYCSWKDSSALGSWAIDSASMAGVNCNCARDWKYYKDNGLELTLVCNGNGNYEPLQRSGELWYCVDSDGFRTSLPQAEKPDCATFVSAP